MSPITRPRSALRTVLAATVALTALAACGREPVDARSPAPAAPPGAPLVVVVTEPAVSPPAPEPVAAAPAAPPSVESAEAIEVAPDVLPRAWAAPKIPGLSFADALRRARTARDGHARLVAPGANAREPDLRVWFTQAQGLGDQASRLYAAAFHAPDATREGRVDAIAEAAELDMTMARTLDDLGLAVMPASWRSDPALASTFEDIAVGPVRRWRDEARVLARQCIETARESGVVTEAARRCALLRTGAPVKVAKRGADAGAPCACSPGDPLCSASLGGWCTTSP